MDWGNIILIFVVGIIVGRITKVKVRLIGVDKQELYDRMEQRGYDSARIGLPAAGVTIEDLNLATHRLEGVVGAVNDTLHDFKQEAKKLNGSDTATSARD